MTLGVGAAIPGETMASRPKAAPKAADAPALSPPPAAIPAPAEALPGWRATLREIGIVTLGVLIAIAFGQVVDAVHWAGEVKTARGQLTTEMARANQNFAFRVAAKACIDRRLDALEDVIERVARRQPVPRLGPVIDDIGNAYNANAWEIHRASQTLSHFGDKELATLSLYYRQVENVRQLVSQEVVTWQTLAVLKGDPSRLGPADIAGLRVAIQNARFDNFLIAGIAEDELGYAKSLGQTIPAADAERLKGVCGPLPVPSAS